VRKGNFLYYNRISIIEKLNQINLIKISHLYNFINDFFVIYGELENPALRGASYDGKALRPPSGEIKATSASGNRESPYEDAASLLP
jgi:hypothetical protein